MKKILIILGLLMVCASMYATNKADTLFLKNGSVILCSVEEYAPAGDIKVKTNDGSLFVYSSSDILRLAKTQPGISNSSSNGQMKSKGVFLYQNGKRLTRNDDISGILGDELNKKYELSQALYMGSWMCLAAGLGFGASYFVFNAKQNDYKEGTDKYEDYQYKKNLGFWAGIGFDAATIVLIYVAQGVTKKVANEYNARHPEFSMTVSPSLIPNVNPNSNLGLVPGITIAYSF